MPTGYSRRHGSEKAINKPPPLRPKPLPFHLDELSDDEGKTVGQRWKFRRNLVIVIAAQNGCSERLLADVFDLPHSRIAAIKKEFRTKYGEA